MAGSIRLALAHMCDERGVFGKRKNGGEESVCGWCKDKYGLSWQINPKNIEELMLNPGAWEKILQMKKIIIEELI